MQALLSGVYAGEINFSREPNLPTKNSLAEWMAQKKFKLDIYH